MPRTRDEAAYRQAITQWVLPECLHIPIVAADEAAITDHIGDVVAVLCPGKAILVSVETAPIRDERLAIWANPRAHMLLDPLQVWVSPRYTRYRAAYIKAKGADSVSGSVLAHVYNRQMAIHRGYGFVRLIPVSSRANSSSSRSEQWGVALAKHDMGARRAKREQRIQYADLSDLLLMLDISLGGGVQEVFRVAQQLVAPAGRRPL